MDYNPDTINKLIGAKVASYKSISATPAKADSKEKLEDIKLKKDIHVNTKPYDMEPKAEEAKSQREQRMEEAYSFLMGELDDIYDDMGIGENNEDNFSDDKTKSYVEGAQVGLGRLAQGAPKRKFYQTRGWHKRNVRKHYDKARREIVGNVAGAVATQKGLDGDKVKNAALLADSAAAPVVRSGAKLVTGSAKRIMHSVKK